MKYEKLKANETIQKGDMYCSESAYKNIRMITITISNSDGERKVIRINENGLSFTYPFNSSVSEHSNFFRKQSK